MCNSPANCTYIFIRNRGPTLVIKARSPRAADYDKLPPGEKAGHAGRVTKILYSFFTTVFVFDLLRKIKLNI